MTSEVAKCVNPARNRILLVTRNLPPMLGGMERLNWHIAEELAKFADVRMVGPTGSAALAPAGVVLREAPLRPLWKFLIRARALARREAKTWKPDVVLAGSGLTAPLVRRAAGACGAKTVAYVHGLDVAVDNRMYRALWLPAIRDMDLVIANSHHTADLAARIGIPRTRIKILNPGVELPGKHDPAAAVKFRQRYDFGKRKLMLSVGRLTQRKGLLEFVERSLPAITATYPDAVLVVAGDEAPHALTGSGAGMGQRIMHIADAAGLKGNVRILGALDESTLSAAYQAADVLVFPVRKLPGDVEGFGMVAIEAAAHGLPTVAFAVGGVSDAVADGQSGHLVVAGDYTALTDAILQALTAGGQLRAGCTAFAQRFSWPVFGAQLAVLMNSTQKPAAKMKENTDA